MTFRCVVCGQTIPQKSDHVRRACGHHLCMACAVPLLRAGKSYCVRCPAPRLATANFEGSLVLGTDGEQNERVAALMRQERAKVCPPGVTRTRARAH